MNVDLLSLCLHFLQSFSLAVEHDHQEEDVGNVHTFFSTTDNIALRPASFEDRQGAGAKFHVHSNPTPGQTGTNRTKYAASQSCSAGWQCSHPTVCPLGLWERILTREYLHNPLGREPSPNNFKKHRILTWGLGLSWSQCFGVKRGSYQLCMMTYRGHLVFLSAQHPARLLLLKAPPFPLGKSPSHHHLMSEGVGTRPKQGLSCFSSWECDHQVGWHDEGKGSEFIHPDFSVLTDGLFMSVT